MLPFVLYGKVVLIINIKLMGRLGVDWHVSNVGVLLKRETQGFVLGHYL